MPPTPSHPSRSAYEFGPFRFEPAEHLLLRDSKPVPLPPKAVDLLAILISSAGHLVTKEDLLKQVWPDTFVEEANLSYTISLLRKALGDDEAPHRYIETVPRRGYRFVGQTAEPTVAQSTSPLGPHVGQGPPPTSLSFRRRVRVLAITIAIPLLLAAAWLIQTSRRHELPARIMPLTTSAGYEGAASFSPDGEQVAFTWDGEKEDNVDIYVKFVGSSEVRRLTTDPDLDGNPAWSPDGRQIAFVRFTSNGARIHTISPLDGSERRVSNFPPTDDGIAWSPDGRYIAALRATGLAIPRQQNTGIYLVPLDGGEPRQLTNPEAPSSDEHPAFSADGRHVGYVNCLRWDGSCDVYVLDLTSAMTPAGRPRRLSRQAFWDNSGLSWSPDQRSIIYDVHIGALSSLWRVDLDGRPPQRIELAGVRAAQPATGASRNRLAFTNLGDNTDIFRFEPGHSPQPLLASSLSDQGGQYSHDGQRVVFASGRSGFGIEVWVASADGSNVQQLTHGPGPWQASPDWSPDDRRIAYDSMAPDGRWHIWTIDADGGSPRQITTEPGEQNVPTWSNDGRWIYFSLDQGAGRQIWRVPAEGGKVEQITHDGSGYLARESIDGQSLLYQTGFRGLPLMKMPLAGGPASQIAECARRSSIVERPEGTYYIRCGEDSEVHLLERFTGRDRALGSVGDWLPDASASLGVSPGGKSFLFTRKVSWDADLMLIDGFR